MNTRCCIGYYDSKDKMIHGIYCHHDGYKEGVGLKLIRHYTTLDKIKKLISLGDLSSVGEIPEYRSHYISNEVLNESNSWWTWDLPDRKEIREEARKYCEGIDEHIGVTISKENAPRVFKSVKEFCKCYDHEYYYIFKKNRWYCNGKPLSK